MRKRSIVVFAVAGAILIGPAARAPARAATSTATIAVTATVLAFCTVTATPLAFGNYSSAQLDATATLAVSCTTGTPYTVGLDAGIGTGATVAAREMAGTVSGSTLSYTLYSDSGRTVVWGDTAGTNTVAGTGNGLAQALTAYGRIPAGQLSAPGAYTDTVTATVTY